MTELLHELPQRTFVCWFRALGPQFGGRIYETTYMNGGIGMYNGNVMGAWYYNGPVECNVVGFDAGPLNEWHHLIYTTDCTTGLGRVFIDGVEVASRTGMPYASPENWNHEFLRFGQGASNETYFGDIDDVAIFNRVLSETEVAEFYQDQVDSIGCTNPAACNFNPEANSEDGSCVAPGCGDPAASNYDADALCSNAEVCAYLPEYLPSDGLIGWWPMDGNAQDLSGNGHHGTEVNTGDGVNRFGEASGALEFFGNSFVWGDCSDFPQLNQTVSVWFKSSDLDQGPSGRSVLGYGGSSCGDSWLMLLDNIGIPGGEDAFNIQGHCNSDGRLLTYEVESMVETWTHWAVVNRPEGIVFYVNGQPSEVGPVFDAFGSGVFTSGRTFNFGMSPSQGGGSGYFDSNVMPLVGTLDDIGIWSRALTDAEVMTLYLGEPPMWGCTDPTACNFNPEANADDGSCVAPGCGDPAASNYDADALCSNAEVCAYLPEYLPSDGLIGWWPFSGSANDESGNGLDGIVLGAEATEDRFGQVDGAYAFSRLHPNVIQVASNPFLDFNEDITISVWARLNSHAEVGQHGYNHYVTGVGEASHRFVLANNVNGLYFYFSPIDAIVTEELPPLNEWFSLVTSYSFGEDVNTRVCKFYLNGILIEEISTSQPLIANAIASLRFGSYGDATHDRMDGKLDDIGIWNRALTDAEVMALYLGEPPMWGCTDSTACNFNPEANADDGSCVPSGCLDVAACNFNSAAGCAGVACVFTCCPGPGCCGEGMVWDVAAQTCTIDPDFITSVEAAAAAEAAEAAVAEALDGVCGPGTVWDSTLGMCTGAGSPADCPSDLSGNGSVGTEDLLILLSEFATLCPVPEPVASACGDLSAVSFDGYSYPLVAIGSQCWFKENLRSDSYRNGDPIPGGLSDAEWTSTTAGAQAVYGEGNSTVYSGGSDEGENLVMFGRLYNWYAVNDPRFLCPVGFHVASDEDWLQLQFFLGGAAVAGTALKSSPGDQPAWDGLNSSGFTALPGGFRSDSNGGFDGGMGGVNWWSSTSISDRAWQHYINEGSALVHRFNNYLRYGFSVRCLKD
jgi:uncharacterized protein (TIGR02145 family)